MITKAKLQEKHGIYRLEPPNEMTRPLTKEESQQYEKNLFISKQNFTEYWDEDDSGDNE